MRRASQVAAAGLLAAASAPAYGQPAAEPAPAAPAAEAAAAPAEKVPEPLEVTVIGTKADALQRVPGSGTVVTSKEIQRAQPSDAGEMLRRVPGITVRQDRDAGNRLDIGVRGLDAPRGRRVLMLEDGVPLAVNPYGEPDLYYGPPIERMRAIEVVKGSGSILFGPQTVGAVINFLTLAPPPRRHASLEVDGGVPAYVKVLGNFGDSVGDGNTRYIAQVFHERGDGFRQDSFLATDCLGKVTFDTSKYGEATLKLGFHDEIDHSTQAGLTREMFAADPRRRTLAPYDRLSLRKYDAALIHELAVGPSTTIRTLAFAYTTSRIWRNQDYERAAVPGTFYQRVVGDVDIPNGALFFKDSTTIPDRVYDVTGVEPRIEHRFTTAGLVHTLYVGTRVLAETAHRQQRRGETASSFAGNVESDETSATYAFATYAQDKLAVTDFLIVTPGLRFEYAHSNRKIARAFVDGAPRDVSIEGTSDVNELIPGIGMIAGSKDNHVFGGLHVGFAPPRLTTAIDQSGVDEQLDAERSINYELGARLGPRKWLRLEATGFASNYENQVIPSTSAGRRTDLVNAGQTRHYGAESSVTIGLGDALKLGTAIDLGARYTFSRARFFGGPLDGHALPYAPLHTASGTLDVEHPSGIGGEVALTFVGDQFTDEENTVRPDAAGRVGRIDAHEMIDLAAKYKHKPTGLTASASIKNVFDDVYVASRRPDGIFPSGFRQFTFGLRWDYDAKPEP